jgi:hypothetical protein
VGAKYEESSYAHWEGIGLKGPEGDALWGQYLPCRVWSMPPDDRIDLSFLKHVLKSIPVEHVENTVKSLKQWLDSSPYLVSVYDVRTRVCITSIVIIRKPLSHSSISYKVLFFNMADFLPLFPWKMQSHIRRVHRGEGICKHIIPPTSTLSHLLSPFHQTLTNIFGPRHVRGLSSSPRNPCWKFCEPGTTGHHLWTLPSARAPLLPFMIVGKNSETAEERVDHMVNIIELHLKATFAKPSGLAWSSDEIMAFHVVLYVICQEGAFDDDGIGPTVVFMMAQEFDRKCSQ